MSLVRRHSRRMLISVEGLESRSLLSTTAFLYVIPNLEAHSTKGEKPQLESNKESIQIGAYAVTNPSGAQHGNLQLTNAVHKSGTKLFDQLVVGQTFESVTLDIQTTSKVSKSNSKPSYLQYTLTSAAVEATKDSMSSDWVITFSFGTIAHKYGVTILPPLGQIEVSKTQDSSSGNLFRAAS
jgi:type VI protein secretion system component Hcp